MRLHWCNKEISHLLQFSHLLSFCHFVKDKWEVIVFKNNCFYNLCFIYFFLFFYMKQIFLMCCLEINFLNLEMYKIVLYCLNNFNFIFNVKSVCLIPNFSFNYLCVFKYMIFLYTNLFQILSRISFLPLLNMKTVKRMTTILKKL